MKNEIKYTKSELAEIFQKAFDEAFNIGTHTTIDSMSNAALVTDCEAKMRHIVELAKPFEIELSITEEQQNFMRF